MRARSHVGCAREGAPGVTTLSLRTQFPATHRFAVFSVLTIALLLCTSSVNAQTRADSARADSLRRPGASQVDTAQKRLVAPIDTIAERLLKARRDSIIAFRKGDTIKSPFARYETPRSFDADDRLRFTRDQILQSEATSLVDLLDRVPGVTGYRTGWLASVQLAAYRGDFSRVRVFIDGVELDANDPRSNGIPDLT
ncbi:MAG: Plug domain-containing protein, partial [Gemmatimonadaceae bacterium]